MLSECFQASFAHPWVFDIYFKKTCNTLVQLDNTI